MDKTNTTARQYIPKRRAPYAVWCICLITLALPTHAQETQRTVTPSEMTSGALLLERDTTGQYVEAPALATDIQIDISGPIARTRITQRFENTSAYWVEGVYVFPLPDESAVDKLRMQIGTRFIEGQIKERKAARAIYEKAKAEGRKTSLLEQERANIFTNSVANIGPGETIIVQIEYQETIRIDDGAFALRVPMVVAPRYNPPAQVLVASIDGATGWAISDPVPDRAAITPPYNHPDKGLANPVNISVDMDAGFAIGELDATYHDMQINFETETRATLKLRDGDIPANRDFELTWSPKSGQSPSAALFGEEIDGEDYFLFMVTPPAPETLTALPPREVTFILDTSGSMGGQSIRQARASLTLAVQRLKPADTFNVIEFNSSTYPLFPSPQPATRANLRQALGWVEGLEARGGTNMLPALRTALRTGGHDTDRLRQVIFLTDGAIGNEQALFETISSERGEARIFTVGIGSAPNSFFMSRAAEIGRGTFTHIGAIDEVAARMGALFAKLETPAITDLSLTWPDGVSVDTSYTLIPDVYQGETLTIAAQASASTGAVILSGTSGDQPWSVSLALEQASARPGISKLWARKKIAALELDRARDPSRTDGLDSSILDIALTHSLISRLTSLVAVDVTPSRPEDATLGSADIPLNFPAGWDFEKVFGEADQLDGRLQQDAAASPAPAPVTVTSERRRSVALPQTATLAELKLWLGALFLAMAAISLIARTRTVK